MNISYNWLCEYVDTTLSAREVADALTSVGLEVDGVEEVQSIRGGLEGVVTGRVLTCEPHPNSDHMHVCSVDTGSGAPVQIVCGAPNVAAGQSVVVATLGAKLYDGDECLTIKRSKLRGVESLGMLCAEDEIGVGPDHSGIITLPEGTPAGLPAAGYYHVESDYLIEVDITPNRADACSHYGVARDLYAWLVQNGHETALHRPSCEDFRVDNEDLPVEISVEAADACPRYCALTLTGCRMGDSPEWLQRRLRTVGLRPINNIVDITNYIMMAYGQPLHCFDADMITGHRVVVKTLPEGTPFVTLDGQEHKLSSRDLAICNDAEPMCIAGVLGGKGSGTYDTTRNVMLESAYFHPTWIRKSARRHGLGTDASFRFERGVDPHGQVYALKQAAIMARELAGAKVSMRLADVCPAPLPDFRVELRYDYLDALVGKHIPEATVKSITRSLEMETEAETSEGLTLRVPAYRVDVQRPCDVSEDILRVYGYNNVEIPESVKSCLAVKGEPDRSHKLQNLVGEQLAGEGFREILNNSLQRAAYYDGLQSYRSERLVRLLNPLSQDLNAMRQTLLFGGLETIARNTNHRQPDLRLFEFGNCYTYTAERRSPLVTPGVSSRDPEVIRHALDAYSEDCHLGLWVTGRRVSGSWAHPDEDSSFAELRAYLMNVLRRLGVPDGLLAESAGESDLFDKSLQLRDRAGKTLAEAGVVAGAQLRKFGIAAPVYYADLRWTRLMRAVRGKTVSYRDISKFPAVSRDLALLLDEGVEFARVEETARRADRKLIQSVRLFDVYEGKNLPRGKKSYAVNITLQDKERTMSDKQIEAVMAKIVKQLGSQLGAELR